MRSPVGAVALLTAGLLGGAPVASGSDSISSVSLDVAPASRRITEDHAQPTSAELLGRIKAALLERRWPDVIADCERHERLFPNSPHDAAVALHKGRALASLGGRENDALSAYRAAAVKAGSDRGLAEEARRSACRVAFDLSLMGLGEGTRVLSDSLGDPARTVRIYAAVLSSRLTDPSLLAAAGRVLRKELEEERNEDLRDEMTLALARIDPGTLPEVSPVPSRPSAAGAADKRSEPRWIHLRITSRSDPDSRVSINLPLSFARALLESLPQKTRDELRRQAEQRGLAWEALSTGLQELAVTGEPLLEVDDGDERVEVWID
jgi:hypothetical protein